MDCIVGAKRYHLSEEELVRSRTLTELRDLLQEKEIVLENVSEDFFLIAYRYLTKGVIPTIHEFGAIDYFGIKAYDSYELSLVQETAMRKDMYSTHTRVVTDHRQVHEPDMYTNDADDNYFAETYGLTIIDQHFWESFHPKRKTTPHTILVGPEPVKSDWSDIQKRLADLHQYTDQGNVFVAGGCIFSILFGLPIADVDLFYHGMTQEEATERLLAFRPEGCTKLLRTKNAITYYSERTDTNKEVQVILRLYKTKAAIINAFDVCSCSVGYNGKNIYATARALYALENLVNTVNFDFLSPTYERRLAKYAARGIAVEVPNFDRTLVDEKQLDDDLLSCSLVVMDMQNTNERYRHLSKKCGLDTLLFLEKHLEHYNYCPKSVNMVKNFSNEISDYNKEGSREIYSVNQGQKLTDLFEYLVESELSYKDDYRDKVMEYTRILDDIPGNDWADDDNNPEDRNWYNLRNKLRGLRTNMMLKCKSVSFIRAADVEHFKEALCIDKDIYEVLSILRPIDFSREVTWKTTKPGEQMTNTFHSIVLDDLSKWYQGSYYDTRAEEEQKKYARVWRIPCEVQCARDLIDCEEEELFKRQFWWMAFQSESYTTTPALLAYAAEHGIQEDDVMYLSFNTNKSYLRFIWKQDKLLTPYHFFSKFCDEIRHDYWSKAIQHYKFRIHCHIREGWFRFNNCENDFYDERYKTQVKGSLCVITYSRGRRLVFVFNEKYSTTH